MRNGKIIGWAFAAGPWMVLAAVWPKLVRKHRVRGCGLGFRQFSDEQRAGWRGIQVGKTLSDYYIKRAEQYHPVSR